MARWPITTVFIGKFTNMGENINTNLNFLNSVDSLKDDHGILGFLGFLGTSVENHCSRFRLM
jgi:hypothetical protein